MRLFRSNQKVHVQHIFGFHWTSEKRMLEWLLLLSWLKLAKSGRQWVKTIENHLENWKRRINRDMVKSFISWEQLGLSLTKMESTRKTWLQKRDLFSKIIIVDKLILPNKWKVVMTNKLLNQKVLLHHICNLSKRTCQNWFKNQSLKEEPQQHLKF